MKRFVQQASFVVRASPRKHRAGFTLLEVVVSLAILAVSLGSLMQTQAGSIDVCGRARDVTIASLLARGKLIDIEQYLLDEGFSLGEERERGNFADEGWPDYAWDYEILEIEMDLLNLAGGLEGMLPPGMGGDGAEAADGLGGMGDAIGALVPMLQPFLDEVGNSFRLVRLNVTWPAGRFTRSAEFSRLVTRRDFSFVPDELRQTLQEQPGQPSGTQPAAGTTPPGGVRR